MYPPAARRAGCVRHRLAQQHTSGSAGPVRTAVSLRQMCNRSGTGGGVCSGRMEEKLNAFLGRAGVLLGLSQNLGAC